MTGKMQLFIPIVGKMAAKVVTNRDFRGQLEAAGYSPVYLLHDRIAEVASALGPEYLSLQTGKYDAYLADRPLMMRLLQFRRFASITETTDLRLREKLVEEMFRDVSIARVLTSNALNLVGRHLPGLRRVLRLMEGAYKTNVHSEILARRANRGGAVLLPGLFNFGFWYEGFFAKEARRAGLPIVSYVANYDNMLNMGYPGMIPDRLCLWSTSMADDAVRYHSIPARKIEITGAMQYDRLLRGCSIQREEFFRARRLDVTKPTILYMGGVNARRYFEILANFIDFNRKRLKGEYNLIVRPYPHPKVLASDYLKLLLASLNDIAGTFLSDALSFNQDGTTDFDRRSVDGEEDLEELNGYLHYSNVMISHFSTASLEAAICDLPCVQVGYDGNVYGLLAGHKVSFLMRQTHNRRPKRVAASWIVYSDAELVAAVERYIKQPDLHRAERRSYSVSELEYLDGRSTQRTIDVLSAIVARR